MAIDTKGEIEVRAFVTPLLVVVLGAGVAASTASASKPLRFPVPSGDFTLAAGTACAFPVGAHVDTNKQHFTVYSDGSARVTGEFVGTVTNLDNPANAVTVNAPGSLLFTPNSDGTTTVKGTGQNVYIFFPGDLGPGRPGALYVLDGKTTLLTGANGAVVPGSFEHDGNIRDLCAALS